MTPLTEGLQHLCLQKVPKGRQVETQWSVNKRGANPNKAVQTEGRHEERGGVWDWETDIKTQD